MLCEYVGRLLSPINYCTTTTFLFIETLPDNVFCLYVKVVYFYSIHVTKKTEIEAKKKKKSEENGKKMCGQDILFILVTMYNLYMANRNMMKESDVLAVSAFRVYSGKLPENF
jgi:hypothetical protein